MVINLDWLTSKMACKRQLDIFRAEWPDGCGLDRKNLERALALGLDLNWLMIKVLSVGKYAEQYEKLAPLEVEYRAKLAPIEAEYKAKLIPLKVEHYRKIDLLDTEYQAKRAPIKVEYQIGRAPIEADYEEKVNAIRIDMLVDDLG